MLSQQELADRAGVSLFTIQRIERGEGSVRPKTGRAVAAALGVGVEELLPKAQPPLPFEEQTLAERREREEYAEALMTIWGNEGEDLEEEVMSSPEGFPLRRAYFFSVGQGFAQALYEEIADARRPSESLQKAKERLDTIGRRIGALWDQTVHPDSAEALREFQTFAQRRAEARRSRDESNNTGTQGTATGRAG